MIRSVVVASTLALLLMPQHGRASTNVFANVRVATNLAVEGDADFSGARFTFGEAGTTNINGTNYVIPAVEMVDGSGVWIRIPTVLAGTNNRLPSQVLTGNDSILTRALADARYGFSSAAAAAGSFVIGPNSGNPTYNSAVVVGEGNGIATTLFKNSAIVGGDNSVSGPKGEYILGFGVSNTIYSGNNGLSFAFGIWNVVNGNGGAWGYDNVVGWGSWAFGAICRVPGQSSIALGMNCSATGSTAIAAGRDTAASGNNSVAIGREAAAFGVDSVAIGRNCFARSNYSLAYGRLASAHGERAMAFGAEAQALAFESFAAGPSARAEAKNSSAIGSYVTAIAEGQTVLGRFNKLVAGTNAPVFLIGSGTAETNRANALAVDATGNMTIYRSLAIQGALRIGAAGDLGMGDFTNGPTVDPQ
jgi:hypothetical protein